MRAERQRRGWSLNDLSTRTDGALSKSRISNYEQGIRRMGLEAAQHLAAALETVTPAWLLLLEEDSRLSDTELALIKDFRALDTKSQQQVIDLARNKKLQDADRAAS
nr:helix-turn-helix transcriptional regulator [Thiorhodococcus mannitoliphagus]